MAVGLEKGRPAPDWYHEEPEVHPGEDFYLEGFHHLSTCRVVAPMVVGQIPWDRIRDYGVHHGLTGSALECFIFVIRELDAVYLDVEAQRLKAEAGQ